MQYRLAMRDSPPGVPLPRRTARLLVGVLALTMAATGLIVVVRADRHPPPAVKPYDPMQSW